MQLATASRVFALRLAFEGTQMKTGWLKEMMYGDTENVWHTVSTQFILVRVMGHLKSVGDG